MITITPAYGRTYTSAKQVKEDWSANKDFLVTDFSCRWDGKLVNRQDYDGAVKVRYGKRLDKVTIIRSST